MIVIDTSVIVKWFSEEKHTEEALKLREKIRNKKEIGVLPDLLLYELTNALRYNPNFDEDDVKDAIESILEMDMDIITLTSDVLSNTISIAFERDITIYDSSYVALVMELESKLVTADKKLYDKLLDLDFVYFIGDIY
ncbi:MAG: type II toxin-antitoxin system VapC family toxin [Candidatus Saliniplasma sp.]